MPIPDTRYADCVDGGQVAYQVMGAGPLQMLCFNGLVTIDAMWEEPRFVQFLDRLSTFVRHIWFDPRGVGSSSPLPKDEPRIVTRVADDMVTVLDALGEERSIVFGMTSPPAVLFAATHPSRTSALVLLDASALFRADDGYPGLDDGEVDRILAAIEREWGNGILARSFGWGGDERAQRWYGKNERQLHTPRDA